MVIPYVLLYFLTNIFIIRPFIERLEDKDMDYDLKAVTAILGPILLAIFFLIRLSYKIRGRK